jgi:recombination protein RecR
VVEDIRDVMAIENTGQFRGIYHVWGKISPIDGIGPSQLKIASLVNKVNLGTISNYFLLKFNNGGDTTNFFYLRQIARYTL